MLLPNLTLTLMLLLLLTVLLLPRCLLLLLLTLLLLLLNRYLWRDRGDSRCGSGFACRECLLSSWGVRGRCGSLGLVIVHKKVFDIRARKTYIRHYIARCGYFQAVIGNSIFGSQTADYFIL